jgi:trans-2-enoyl-CoA reductase
VRFCVWLAPDVEELKKIFSDLEISWDSMTEVEETTPDMWGEKWEEHIKAETTADTLGF